VDDRDVDRSFRLLHDGVTDLDLPHAAFCTAKRGVGLLLRRPAASVGALNLFGAADTRGDGDLLRRRLARFAVARPPDVRLRPPV